MYPRNLLIRFQLILDYSPNTSDRGLYPHLKGEVSRWYAVDATLLQLKSLVFICLACVLPQGFQDFHLWDGY